AILLVAKGERKIRIEVGRGLEGRLTDLVSGRIIRDRMAPRFKAGDFDGGVLAGVQAIAQVVRGEYQAKGEVLRHAKKSAPPIYSFLIFLLVAVVFLGSISRILGGLAGGAGLPLVAWFLYPGLSLAFLGGLVVAGFVLGIVVTLLFGSGGFGGPFFGGWYGGGGWGGSSGGGGGFSGGGGDFGGGGASGEW
ncbi:MAG TPA: TPM domain-containing protein, partial [Candidatus Methylomirabilis sp.]|nr:TPM domain-containing protein [Candidatus Methylomirabilis sp.]